MNNCLADLSRLIPSAYTKKGRGRIEKTEIIEMAIKHMKHLQHHPCNKSESCDLQNEISQGLTRTASVESFRVGYHECLTECMHFLVEKQGLYSADSFCVRMKSHLQKHFDRLGKASPSAGHSVGGDGWSGIKSEYGAGSDESGYASGLKMEEDPVNLVTEGRGREERSGRARSYSPDKEALYRGLPVLEELPGVQQEGEHEEEPLGLYKFKSNIQQRFTMDAAEDEEPKAKRGREAREEGGQKRSSSPLPLDLPQQSELPTPKTHPVYSTTEFLPVHPPAFVMPKALYQPVPIFALNTKGSFYVPLTLDLSVLTPLLPSLPVDEAPNPCHPVTIQVNFRGSLDASPAEQWQGRGVIQPAPTGVIRQCSGGREWSEIM